MRKHCLYYYTPVDLSKTYQNYCLNLPNNYSAMEKQKKTEGALNIFPPLSPQDTDALS